MTADLARQVVISPHGEEMPFRVEAIRRDALLEGLDEIGLTMQHGDAITAYKARDAAARPWIWRPGLAWPRLA